MSRVVENSIRGKIADIQIFLGKINHDSETLRELDQSLDPAMKLVQKAKAEDSGGDPCEKS